MKYLISRITNGHYECYYRGHLFTVYMVEQSVVSLGDKGNKQRWMCDIGTKTIWADTKTEAIKSAIKTLELK